LILEGVADEAGIIIAPLYNKLERYSKYRVIIFYFIKKISRIGDRNFRERS
jgi:hypothetical protein